MWDLSKAIRAHGSELIGTMERASTMGPSMGFDTSRQGLNDPGLLSGPRISALAFRCCKLSSSDTEVTRLKKKRVCLCFISFIFAQLVALKTVANFRQKKGKQWQMLQTAGNELHFFL